MPMRFQIDQSGEQLYMLYLIQKDQKRQRLQGDVSTKNKNNIKLKSSSSKKSLSRITGDDIDAQDQSIEIGKHILKEMRKDVRIRKKTPREAEFAVLKSTSIASVLIETSYLSIRMMKISYQSTKSRQNC